MLNKMDKNNNTIEQLGNNFINTVIEATIKNVIVWEPDEHDSNIFFTNIDNKVTLLITSNPGFIQLKVRKYDFNILYDIKEENFYSDNFPTLKKLNDLITSREYRSCKYSKFVFNLLKNKLFKK